ncbi:F-actin-capping protein subunit alpha [Aphelenchoides besseyi]|nr:F-actin-capping protein subunit alpha [Aphelenchoides besseyi]
MTTEEMVTDTEKLRIAAQLVQEAPPGEFNEVWNDVRVLLSDDNLMSQCTPATLLTNYNELPEGRFFDPVTKKSFKFNFMSKVASDVQPFEPPHVDEKLEIFRKAVQTELDSYIQEHYHKNGRWRSQWEIPPLDKNTTIEIKGISRINVHYYEDGNVQLCTKKDLTAQAKYSSDANETAKNVLAAIEKAESHFENAVLQNYNVMSDNTFKMLRRRLPITRSKFDWQNCHSYRIAQEIKPQYHNLAPNMPSWRLSASRTSGYAPNGFVQSSSSRGSRGSSGFGSAFYTAVPPSTNARLHQQQHDAFVGDQNAQLEFERQFFADDDATAEQENRVGSRLELRR